MADRVFNQRLQDQARELCVGTLFIHLNVIIQSVPQALFLDLQIVSCIFNFILYAHCFIRIVQVISQIAAQQPNHPDSLFGTFQIRIGRNHIECIEQKMRI